MPAINSNNNYQAPRPSAPPRPAPQRTATAQLNPGPVRAYIPPMPVKASGPAAPARSGELFGGVAKTVGQAGRAIAAAGVKASRSGQTAKSSKPGASALEMALTRLWSGPDRAFMSPTDPVLNNRSASQYQRGVGDMQTQGMFNQDFSSLKGQGLLPAGAAQPPLNFPSRGAGQHGGLSYEKHGQVYISPETTFAATNPQSGMAAWGQETLIHELAHALQSQKTLSSVPLREGGAQAFADAAAPRVLGPIPTNDTNYSRYVRSVRAKQGAPWYMRGQFR